jgi:hypothetical protein
VSYVEAQRAKYKARLGNSGSRSRNSSTTVQRDEETCTKLLNFRRNIRNQKSKNPVTVATTNPTHAMNHSTNYNDGNTVASRMAQRLAQQQYEEEERRKREQDDKSDDTTYRGQILYGNSDDGDDDDCDPSSSWLSTKFECCKHIDLLSGDGKDAMEDYQVIDHYQPSHSIASHVKSRNMSNLPHDQI